MIKTNTHNFDDWHCKYGNRWKVAIPCPPGSDCTILRKKDKLLYFGEKKVTRKYIAIDGPVR